MEHKSHGSPSFINIAVLLLFAVIIAIASTATTYYFLSSKTNEQQTIIQPPIVSPAQTNIIPTTQTTILTDETAHWSVYRNEKYKYEIKYPNSWNFVENQLNAQYILSEIGFGNPVAPVGTESGNPINIDVLPNSLQEAMNDFGAHNRRESSRENIIIGEKIQAKKIEGVLFGLNGGPADKYDGLTTTSVFFQKAGLVYEIRFQEQTKNDVQAQTIFNQMLSTFKFLK